MKNESPCRYCERRHCGCHTICTDYKKWKAEQDRLREERNLESRSTPEPSKRVKQWLWDLYRYKRR